METVLLIDSDLERRSAMKRAIERRGMTVTGEAGSIAEVITAVASLDRAPDTVLVGAGVVGARSARVARLLKRTWPRATVVHEMTPEERQETVPAPRLRVAVAG
ncbi:MAG TPA: hypothetical protein VM840_12210 [Actinomycetota bacterium]|nr:hypothetical protein [Actinomycetota bacterium]